MYNLIDYALFANPSFDANEYANAVLAGEPYPAASKPPTTSTRANFQVPPKTPLAASSAGQEDLSVALAKLNYGIDDVSKQLRGVVRALSLQSLTVTFLIVQLCQIVNHHEDLLARAAGVSELESSLQSVRHGLDTVGLSVEKCTRQYSCCISAR